MPEIKASINTFVETITKRWTDAAANQGMFDVLLKLKTRKNLPVEVTGGSGGAGGGGQAAAASAVPSHLAAVHIF